MKNWGGVRERAGRKKVQKSWSDKFKRNLWKALEKQAKMQGMTVFEVFANRIFKWQARGGICQPVEDVL
jgi:hypothetical protein